MLVHMVRQRRTAVAAPPFTRCREWASPGQTVVWGYMEGLWVETPKGPLGQAALG